MGGSPSSPEPQQQDNDDLISCACAINASGSTSVRIKKNAALETAKSLYIKGNSLLKRSQFEKARVR
jgi:hypothetical protein